jgi:hypothetical protein
VTGLRWLLVVTCCASWGALPCFMVRLPVAACKVLPLLLLLLCYAAGGGCDRCAAIWRQDQQHEATG